MLASLKEERQEEIQQGSACRLLACGTPGTRKSKAGPCSVGASSLFRTGRDETRHNRCGCVSGLGRLLTEGKLKGSGQSLRAVVVEEALQRGEVEPGWNLGGNVSRATCCTRSWSPCGRAWEPLEDRTVC